MVVHSASGDHTPHGHPRRPPGGVFLLLISLTIIGIAYRQSVTSGQLRFNDVHSEMLAQPSARPGAGSQQAHKSSQQQNQHSPSGASSKALVDPSTLVLSETWGYASERNRARWKLISGSLAKRWAGHGTSDTAAALATPMNQQQHHATVIDFGADQGYFSISAATFLRQLWALHHKESPDHNNEPLKVNVLGVEKGGFGGSFWHKDKMKKKTVLDIFKGRAKTHLKDDLEKGIGVHLCSTTVGTGDFAHMRARHCLPDVQFLLSMLHWIEGIDGRGGFDVHVCSIVSAARTTFFELPHPEARRTFGDKRYRGWYDGRKNLTAIFVEALEGCSCDSTIHEKRSNTATTSSVEKDASIVDGKPRRKCRFSLELVGSTPWNRRLHREIHRIDKVIDDGVEITDADEDSIAKSCMEVFPCSRVV